MRTSVRLPNSLVKAQVPIRMTALSRLVRLKKFPKQPRIDGVEFPEIKWVILSRRSGFSAVKRPVQQSQSRHRSDRRPRGGSHRRARNILGKSTWVGVGRFSTSFGWLKTRLAHCDAIGIRVSKSILLAPPHRFSDRSCEKVAFCARYSSIIPQA